MNKYLPDGSSENGISISVRTESGWSFPSPIEVEDFYNEHRTGEYALGSDGKTILMAVQRQDAIGEKDIYVSFKKEDGSWAAPMNLGPEINTGDSEIAPFLAADGRTVYFSTGGYPGYGGQDMFVSRRLDDSWKKWSKPLNLGPKLNTTGFDAYYSLPASGDYAYFTSTQSKVGNSDIFRVKLPKSAKPEPVVLIRGRVLNAKTNDPLGATITYESLTSGKQLGTARSHPTTGEYSIVLPSRDVYGFLAEHKGFLSLNENIDLVKINEYKEMRVDLKLTPLEVGAAVRLNNIFFDTNKYNLKPEDELELKRVVKMLQAYPNMQIEISGHTDNIGADQSNLTLSSNRAKAVTDYLVAKGVAKNRLQAIGLGKTKPVSDNKTEEGRANNRRIEMKILKVE
jgi:flagellar motor protein MotB